MNDLNRAFYETVGEEFDQSRSAPWAGWFTLLPLLKRQSGERLAVLDVGCGNGRFGTFLGRNVSSPILYHGLDSNAGLLEHARKELTQYAHVTVRLDQQDILEQPPDEGAYDLVALFGVLHHIPGAENRVNLLRTLAERVAPGGLLAYTCWRFYEIKNLRERIIDWPDDLERESGDYLLDWQRGVQAIRYCHFVDDAEVETLSAAVALPRAATYRADGPNNSANLYLIHQRPQNS